MALQSSGVSSQGGRVTDMHVQLLPTNSKFRLQVYVLVLSTDEGSPAMHCCFRTVEMFRKNVQAADTVGKV